MKNIKIKTVYVPVGEFHNSERAICTIGIPDLYGDKVVQNEHGTQFPVEDLSDAEIEIFYANI